MREYFHLMWEYFALKFFDKHIPFPCMHLYIYVRGAVTLPPSTSPFLYCIFLTWFSLWLGSTEAVKVLLPRLWLGLSAGGGEGCRRQSGDGYSDIATANLFRTLGESSRVFRLAIRRGRNDSPGKKRPGLSTAMVKFGGVAVALFAVILPMVGTIRELPPVTATVFGVVAAAIVVFTAAIIVLVFNL